MSSNEFAIKISNLSKCYEVYSRPADRLKQFIYPAIKRLLGRNPNNYYREFWALKDVSFDVRRGEAVGIVGRNGAGKSTLLQLIAGTLAPTSGDVQVNGRVAALLELGSGFNPEFTGRENVYLNASILGLSAQEVDKRFEEIASFADIGDFIDQPLSTYSSGMMMRLAFAVNTCVSPDILIVDEALGVGDAPFQAKCFKRLRELSANGTSLLFVSHDIEIVRSLCSRALWLKKGVPENWGEAKEVTKGYERYCWEEQGIQIPQILEANEGDGSSKKPVDLEKETFDGGLAFNINKSASSDQLNVRSNAYNLNHGIEIPVPLSGRSGTHDVIVKKIFISGSSDMQTRSFAYNEELKLSFLVELKRNIDSEYIIGLRIKDLKDHPVFSANNLEKIHRIVGFEKEKFWIEASFSLPLTHQDYSMSLAIFGFSDGCAYSNGKYEFSKAVFWDILDNFLFFRIREYTLFPLAGPAHGNINLKISKQEKYDN
jgi:lipopolysaccharide transport system ATP-binding protein